MAHIWELYVIFIVFSPFCVMFNSLFSSDCESFQFSTVMFLLLELILLFQNVLYS
jgi:hypothetical protein